MSVQDSDLPDTQEAEIKTGPEGEDDTGALETTGDEGADEQAAKAQAEAEYHEQIRAALRPAARPQPTARREAEPEDDDEEEAPRSRRRREEPELEDDEDERPRARKSRTDDDDTDPDWEAVETVLDKPVTKVLRRQFARVSEQVTTMGKEIKRLHKELERRKGMDPDLARIVERDREQWRDEVHGGLDDLAKEGFAEILGADRPSREAKREQIASLLDTILEGAYAAQKIAKSRGESKTLRQAIVDSFKAATGKVPKPAMLAKFHAGAKAAARTGGVAGGVARKVGGGGGHIPREAMIATLSQGLKSINGGG